MARGLVLIVLFLVCATPSVLARRIKQRHEIGEASDATSNDTQAAVSSQAKTRVFSIAEKNSMCKACEKKDECDFDCHVGVAPGASKLSWDCFPAANFEACDPADENDKK